jgi:hypothetical protein
MAVMLSALCAGRPLPQGRFLVLIPIRGWVDPRAIVRLEGLGRLKNLMTSSGIEPVTYLPACNIVPQQTTLPCAPIYYQTLHILSWWTTGAENTVVAQPLKKSLEFYRTRTIITVSTTARHWSLSWTAWIQSTALILLSFLLQYLPSFFFALFLPKLFLSRMRATWPYLLILLVLIILILSVEEYNSRNSLLRSFLYPPNSNSWVSGVCLRKYERHGTENYIFTFLHLNSFTSGHQGPPRCSVASPPPHPPI